MSKIHKKTGSTCIICDESLTKDNSITFHKTRRQTHSLCLDCGVEYLSPILIQATKNVRKNMRKGVDKIKCPGSIHGEHRNICKYITTFSSLHIPESKISLDVFRLNYVLQTPNVYICPDINCGQLVDIDHEYNGNNLICYGGCMTSWCRHCLISPYHNGKSCIEAEAENNNTENGKLIFELKNQGKLKFCPICRSPCIKDNGCFFGDVPILLWNGKIKNAKDIVIGDELIGDDGNKRIVRKVFSGTDKMYKVHQNKADDYIVNGNHTLVLKVISHKYVYNKHNKWKVKWYDYIDNRYRINNFNLECDARLFCDKIINDDTVNITVFEYLKLSKKSKKCLYGFRSSSIVNWEEKQVKIDPYILGTLLDDKIKNNKNIPQDYFVNDKSIRLSLIAGIIDTNGCLSNDGKRFIIVQTNKKLSEQIVLLSRSLGFFTTYRTEKIKNIKFPGLIQLVYNVDCYIINISGEKLSDIPTRLVQRNKCINSRSNKDYLSSINIKNVGEDKYYGWIVDGNHRFIMSDFTVTHNCNKMLCASCGGKWCWLCENKDIDYDHFNSGILGVCNGKLWEGVDENGNALPDRIQ